MSDGNTKHKGTTMKTMYWLYLGSEFIRFATADEAKCIEQMCDADGGRMDLSDCIVQDEEHGQLTPRIAR